MRFWFMLLLIISCTNTTQTLRQENQLAEDLSPKQYNSHILTSFGSSGGVDAGEGRTAFHEGPIFMLGALRDAPDKIYLHVQGIRAEPGSEAELYLIDQTLEGYGPNNYVGSIVTADEGASAPAERTLEITDYEAGGVQYKARTSFREMHSWGLAMVVKSGKVTVEKIILTTATLPQWKASLKAGLVVE